MPEPDVSNILREIISLEERLSSDTSVDWRRKWCRGSLGSGTFFP